MKTTNALQVLALAICFATATEACAYFDPTVGRWASRDPIGEQGGPHLLAFVANDPVNSIDPLGQDFIAVGSRYVTFLPGIVRHMSIEFYQEQCPNTPEGHRFTSRTVPTGARRFDQYELLPRSHIYRSFFTTRPRPAGPLVKTFVWEHISEIVNSSDATELVVIYSDFPNARGSAQRNWRTVAVAAQNYSYAEHPVGPVLQNWPNSKYQFPWEKPGNNSNTFIRDMAHSIGKDANVIGGNHPGAQTAGSVPDPGYTPTYSPW